MNIEQERKDFEGFASKHGLSTAIESNLHRSHVVAWMWKAWQAPADLQSQDREDAERFRWLTEDHADAATRTRCREILDRMAVMSYSAAVTDIDCARRNEGDEE